MDNLRAELQSSEATPRRYGLARAVLVLALVLAGLWTIKGFLPALAWAVILALAVWPLYRRTEERFPSAKHNFLLPAIFTGGIALLFVVPLIIAGIQIERELRALIEWYPHVQETGLPAPDWLSKLSFGNWSAAQWWRENLGNPAALAELFRHIDHATLISLTRQLGEAVARRSVLFFFTLLTLFFLFRDGPSLTRHLIVASARIFGPHGERLGRQMVASIHGTVDGLVLVGLGEGFLLGVAYVMAGVPHPTLLGALTAIAAMIPFGAPILFVLAALLLLAQGAIAGAIGIVVFGFIVVMVADHVIRPVLIGGATKLPFVWVLFGILGGVETWGLLGLFLGPAIMAALILLWREVTERPVEMQANVETT